MGLRRLMLQKRNLAKDIYYEVGLRREQCLRQLVRLAEIGKFQQLQREAFWCLTNVASCQDLARELVEAGYLPVCRKVLRNE